MSEWEDRRVDRRQALKAAGAVALGWAASSSVPLLSAPGLEEKPKKRILMYTRSQGFEHSAVKRKGDELSFAEKLMVDLGPSRGFEVTATKDGRLFTEDNLARYDAFFFYSSGDPTAQGGDGAPPMPPEGKRAFLEAVASGKGFVGTHCANDTFHSAGHRFETQKEEERDPFIRMLGGEFISHGPQQAAVMRVASPRFPGCGDLGESFSLFEEWYSNKNFLSDLHVILVQETKGMKGSDYQRPPFPSTWARRHKKGRVFYTSMGHREDVWTNPIFQKILLGGIDWALGRVEADVMPNISAVTPEAAKLPPRPGKES